MRASLFLPVVSILASAWALPIRVRIGVVHEFVSVEQLSAPAAADSIQMDEPDMLPPPPSVPASKTAPAHSAHPSVAFMISHSVAFTDSFDLFVNGDDGDRIPRSPPTNPYADVALEGGSRTQTADRTHPSVAYPLDLQSWMIAPEQVIL